jgi:hypothetical protein
MQSQPELQLIILDDENYAQQNRPATATFRDFFSRGETSRMPEFDLAAKKSLVRASDIINYQFTSGMSTAKLLILEELQLSKILYRHYRRPESGNALTCVRQTSSMACI